MDARVGGTASAPVVTGRAALDGVDVANAEGGFAIEGATGSFLFSEGRVTISGLSLRYAGGTADLGGTILLDGLKPTGIRISALVSHVKVSPFEGFRATFSGNLLLLGDSQPRAVRGELVFDRAIYDRDFSIDLAALLQRKRVATVGRPRPSSTPSRSTSASWLRPTPSRSARTSRVSRRPASSSRGGPGAIRSCSARSRPRKGAA